jgi:cytochrome c peroxidase
MLRPSAAAAAPRIVEPLENRRGAVRRSLVAFGVVLALLGGCDDGEPGAGRAAQPSPPATGSASPGSSGAAGAPPKQPDLASLQAACEARRAVAESHPDGFEIDDRLPAWDLYRSDVPGDGWNTGDARGSCKEAPRLDLFRIDAAYCGPCNLAADSLATSLEPVAHLLTGAAAATTSLVTILYADEEGVPALGVGLQSFRAAHPTLPGELVFAGGTDVPGESQVRAAVDHHHVLPLWFLVDGRTGVILDTLDNPSPDRLAPAVAAAYETLTGIATDVPKPSAAKVDGRFRADEWALLQRMRLPHELPPSPSNAHADDVAAATLGATLFHDDALAGDGGFACVSCHRMDKFLADGLPVAIAQGTGTRNTPSIAFAAFGRYQFWDGRADSLWSQALGPIENPLEMAGSRLGVVARLEAAHHDAYVAAFGPFPAFSATLPKAGRPGDPAYDALPKDDRAAVDRVFVNAGKALEAFERALTKNQPPSRFDRYLDGDKTALTDEELDGAALFLSAGCATCHHGPALSDGAFHNIWMPSREAPADRGRDPGLLALLLSPFRADGAFSDDPAGAPPIPNGGVADARLGQQKTPSLRNVTKTAPYGHAGVFDTIGEVLAHYGKPRTAPVPGGLTIGQMDPAVGLFATPHAKSIEAFLGTLSSP